MNNKSKYLKYKTKYLNLQNQFSGSSSDVFVAKDTSSKQYKLTIYRYSVKKRSFSSNKNKLLKYLTKDEILKLNVKYNTPFTPDIYDLTNEKFNTAVSLWKNIKNINKDLSELINEYTRELGIKSECVSTLLKYSKGVLYTKKLTVPTKANVYLIGDIHSSLESLRQILNRLNSNGIFDNNNFKLKSLNYIIFLGDMVDRGPYSIEILLIIARLKNNNKDNVFLINGNHEDRLIYDQGGLTDEIIKEHYINDDIHKLLKLLPAAIFLNFEGDNKCFHLSHGGIDPYYNHSKQKFVNNINIINESFIPYDLNGLKWTDFDNSQEDYIKKPGRSYVYGIKKTKKYIKNNNIYSIISGHQDNVNLALLTDKQFDKFSKCIKEPYMQKAAYNLICPENENTTEQLYFDPTSDFYALTTSTCTESKSLPFDSYMLLQKK